MSTENDKNVGDVSEQTEGKKGFKWSTSPNGVFETYSNFTHTSWSLYDVRVQFGQLRPELGDSKAFVVEERAAITVSWAHAKQLLKALGPIIESYEKTNGEILPLKLPPTPNS